MPSKRPWLNPIAAKWVHGKRRMVEPISLPTLEKLDDRVYAARGADHAARLAMPQQTA